MPDQTSQAPVAGADPRAWRELARGERVRLRLLSHDLDELARDFDRCDLMTRRSHAQLAEAGKAIRTLLDAQAQATAALRDAAEARPYAALAQQACEDVAAELSPLIDPECTDPSELACRAAYEITERRAAAARGAEGERYDWRSLAARLQTDVSEAHAALDRHGVLPSSRHGQQVPPLAERIATLAARPTRAPRPSAGPAAAVVACPWCVGPGDLCAEHEEEGDGEEEPLPFALGTDPDAESDPSLSDEAWAELRAEMHAEGSAVPAARTRVDPAREVGETPELRAACEQYGRELDAYRAGNGQYPSSAPIVGALRNAERLAAPAAPEVPRG